MTGPLTTPVDRWPSFRDGFFAPPNMLDISRGIPELDQLLSVVVKLLAAEPARPIVVPAVVDRVSYYYGIAFTQEQSRGLRELLQSHVGVSWSDFDGLSVHGSALDDPLVKVATEFAGDTRYVYRLRVAKSARDRVRASVLSLLGSLGSAPRRQARLAVPIGRLVGDLSDACAAGAEDAASRTYAMLAADHRISERNRLFLQVQLLAAFDRWGHLAAHPMLDSLLKLDRPSRVSDALARMAIAGMPETPTLEAFQPIATRFGSLIDSVTVIRTPAGAQFYTLWALSAGEDPDKLRQRLTEAGWAIPTIINLLKGRQGVGEAQASTPEELRAVAQAAIHEGRYDTAIEVLAELPPDASDLPAVIEAVTHTFTAAALALLERHRAAHGEEILRQAGTLRPVPATAGTTLVQQLRALFDLATPQAEIADLTAAIERTGVAELRVPGGAESVCQTLRDLIANDGPMRLADGLEVCVDLVRDLKAGEAQTDVIRSLSRTVLELWAFCDKTGDRRRAARIGQLVTDAVEVGLSLEEFDEVVELLRAGWDPFLTDADLPGGLDILEHLIAYQPTGSVSLGKFAIPMLSRIGSHNVARLPLAARMVAADIAPTFGLSVELPAGDTSAVPAAVTHAGLKIALYSLEQAALARAAKILHGRYPGLEFVVSSDHVASESLKVAARTADLFVVADRAAKHAATQAVKADRPAAPIRYAAGKGSTSLIETVETWLRERQADTDDVS